MENLSVFSFDHHRRSQGPFLEASSSLGGNLGTVLASPRSELGVVMIIVWCVLAYHASVSL